MALVSKGIDRILDSLAGTPGEPPDIWAEILAYIDFGEPLEVYAVNASGDRVSDIAPIFLSREGCSITAPGVDLTATGTSKVEAAHIRVPNSGRWLQVDITAPTVVYAGQSLSFNNVEIYLKEA